MRTNGLRVYGHVTIVKEREYEKGEGGGGEGIISEPITG